VPGIFIGAAVMPGINKNSFFKGAPGQEMARAI